MQMKVPNRAPINPTRSLKNGIASAMRKEMIQLNSTHELVVSRRRSDERGGARLCDKIR